MASHGLGGRDTGRVPMKLSDFSVLDSEFGNMRERFDNEMSKMEDEMNKFRYECYFLCGIIINTPGVDNSIESLTHFK